MFLRPDFRGGRLPFIGVSANLNWQVSMNIESPISIDRGSFLVKIRELTVSHDIKFSWEHLTSYAVVKPIIALFFCPEF